MKLYVYLYKISCVNYNDGIQKRIYKTTYLS